jgi:hypothetical protein
MLVAGTSEASPLFAGVVALAEHAARHRLGFTATPDFDLASGRGTIDTARFVPELTGTGGDD